MRSNVDFYVPYIVVRLVRNTLLCLIIKVYGNDCPRNEGTLSIKSTKASGDTTGDVMAGILSVSVMEQVEFNCTTPLQSLKSN